MFGSWKPRIRRQDNKNQPHPASVEVQQVVAWDNDDTEVLSEIEEELSAFINRQLKWQGLANAKPLPSWMKTASLNRCERIPPLPPKKTPPIPPPRRRSRSRIRDLGGSLSSSTTWTPTPPLRRHSTSRSSRSASLQSIQPWAESRHILQVSYLSLFHTR